MFTLSVRSGHSPDDFCAVGYCLGHEGYDLLSKFTAETGWCCELGSGMEVVVDGVVRKVVVFLCGDHQLHVRMRACRAPNAKEGRCPHCRHTGEVLSHTLCAHVGD